MARKKRSRSYFVCIVMSEDDVDSDLRRCQNIMQEAYAHLPPYDPWSVDELRRATAIVRAPWWEGGPTMKRSEEKRVGNHSTRIRIYYPVDDRILPALIYLHGGGWTIFSIDTHDRLTREYAHRAGIAVIAIDYSLSPEAKFPRAIEEIVSVVQWLRKQNSAELGIDVRRLAIGGDSAGANLSVATNLRLRSLNEPVLKAQLLNYGVYARDRPDSGSYIRYDGPQYRLTPEEVDFFRKNYVQDERDLDDPLVSPLHADLRGLPSSLLAIAQCDILADENRAMANALRNANVDVDEHVYQGATHSFLEAVKIAAISGIALDDAARWLTRQLHDGE